VRIRRLIVAALLVLCVGAGHSPAQSARSRPNGPADSLQRKVDYLAANGAREHPDRRPTVLTDEEVDAYMNSGGLKVPAGISDIHLVTTPSEATATAEIDFDRLTRDVRKGNLLWELFSGVHDVKVRAGVWGKDGMGNVHVQHVWLDDHEVPRFALEFFLQRYLKPRVPQASLDARFRLPARIQTATVGSGKTTLVQK
jgi:hypothetical protein